MIIEIVSEEDPDTILAYASRFGYLERQALLDHIENEFMRLWKYHIRKEDKAALEYLQPFNDFLRSIQLHERQMFALYSHDYLPKLEVSENEKE